MESLVETKKKSTFFLIKKFLYMKSCRLMTHIQKENSRKNDTQFDIESVKSRGESSMSHGIAREDCTPKDGNVAKINVAINN